MSWISLDIYYILCKDFVEQHQCSHRILINTLTENSSICKQHKGFQGLIRL